MVRFRVAAVAALVVALAGCSQDDPVDVAERGTPLPPATVAPPSPIAAPSARPSASPSPSPTPTCDPGPPAPAPDAATAPRISGPLHVCGPALVDADGSSVRLLAVAYSGLQQGQGLPAVAGTYATGCEGWLEPREEDYDNMAEAGFNAVRLAISWANLEPEPPVEGSHDYDDRYLAVLDDAVAELTDRGVAVVLDMHQVRWSPAFHDLEILGSSHRVLCQGSGMPAWLYPEGGGQDEMVAAERAFFLGEEPEAEAGLVDAWTFLVDRYADEPLMIGVDILNEPYDLLTAPYPGVDDLGPVDMALTEFYERVGGEIQEHNPDLLLFVEDNISRRSGLFSLTREPELDNFVYAPHFYQETWDEIALDRLVKYHVRAAYWDRPIWLSEMTRFALDEDWAASLASAVAYLKEQGVGWALWSYRPDWFVPGTTQYGIADVLREGF